MIRAILIVAGICLLTQSSYCQDPGNSGWTDPKLGGVIKVRPLSWASGYLMAGTEIPIGKKNRYLDFNIGIPNVGVPRYDSGPGGILLRSGIKLPMRHTSPYSIFYWMPEFNWGTYLIKNYYCYSCTSTTPPQPGDFRGRQWGIGVDFGYRHVNPATFFFFEGGFGIGYGGQNHSDYDIRYNMVPGRQKYNEDGSVVGSFTTAHFTIGKAFRRKIKN